MKGLLYWMGEHFKIHNVILENLQILSYVKFFALQDLKCKTFGSCEDCLAHDIVMKNIKIVVTLKRQTHQQNEVVH